MNRRAGVERAIGGLLIAVTVLAAAPAAGAPALTQPITEDSLRADMLRVPVPEARGLPPGCRDADVVFRAALQFRSGAKPPVSTAFAADLQSLALKRKRGGCAKCPEGQTCPPIADAAALVETHDRLVKDLRTCVDPACGPLQTALMTNFVDLVRESPPQSPNLARLAGEMVLSQPLSVRARELVGQISRGAVPADVLLDLIKVALARSGDDKQAASMLTEIASFLAGVSRRSTRVSEPLLQDVFASVLQLISNQKLSEDKIRALLAEIHKIASDEDVVRLGEIAKLQQDLKQPQSWQSLRQSIDIMTAIYPELKAKLPVAPPDGASRDAYLLALVNIMKSAELVELNRLQAAQHEIRLTPESFPHDKVLVVIRDPLGCDARPDESPCLLGRDLRRGFLTALGANAPEGIALATIKGEPAEVLEKASEMLEPSRQKDGDGEETACDRENYGSLCEKPYAGVVFLSMARQEAGILAQVGWRIRDEAGHVNNDPLSSRVVSDQPRALRAGFDKGVEALRNGTLWKVVAKETPVEPEVKAKVEERPPVGLKRRLALTSSALLNAGLPLLLDRTPGNDALGVTLAATDGLVLGTIAVALWQARQQREAFERGQTSSLRGADQMYGVAISAALTYLGVKAIGLTCGYAFQGSKQ